MVDRVTAHRSYSQVFFTEMTTLGCLECISVVIKIISSGAFFNRSWKFFSRILLYKSYYCSTWNINYFQRKSAITEKVGHIIFKQIYQFVVKAEGNVHMLSQTRDAGFSKQDYYYEKIDENQQKNIKITKPYRQGG